MRSLIIVGMLIFIAGACSPTNTPAPQPTEGTVTTPVASLTSAAPVSPTQAVASEPAQAAAPSAAPVSLEVLTPQDNAVVNAAQITVSGRASPDAVVTVNDDILIVGPDGKFQDTVTLTEGLNLIEVIASNTSGSEASAEITVTYEP